MSVTWDYLILTASNDRQAAGYEGQLEVRRRAGLLPEVGKTLVVADPLGKRVGSGGSTLYCLMEVIKLEIERGQQAGDWAAIESLFKKLRILILHAGGDSRRVPAYGPCGKIFSPVPGESRGGLISTLFDRLYPIFRDMPQGPHGAGQVIVAAGDALPLFDTSLVRFDRPGMTALGAYATPEAASKHGVFCVAEDGHTRLFLQKPSPLKQQETGANDAAGRAVLDIGVMSFDAAAAVALFKACDVQPARPAPCFSHEMQKLILEKGMDLYREICCALGSEATADHHRADSLASGSHWSPGQLAKVFEVISHVPFSTVVLPQCEFLHFGTTKQLITSGMEVLKHDGLHSGPGICLSLNNRLGEQGMIVGGESWVEGCQIAAPLRLAGQNVVVGIDIDDPLELPDGACIDVIAGESRTGRKVWFVRMYHIADTFKDVLGRGGTLCGIPLGQWLMAAGADPAAPWQRERDVTVDAIWPDLITHDVRSLWNARVFPAVASLQDYCNWLWMFDPARATEKQKLAFLQADRYSVAEIALLADMDTFYSRRSELCDTP